MFFFAEDVLWYHLLVSHFVGEYFYYSTPSSYHSVASLSSRGMNNKWDARAQNSTKRSWIALGDISCDLEDAKT